MSLFLGCRSSLHAYACPCVVACLNLFLLGDHDILHSYFPMIALNLYVFISFYGQM